MPKIFLINLDRSPDRLAFMQGQFRDYGIEAERISAVDGANVPAWLAEEFRGPHQLTPNEMGCYASHLIAAHRIVAECLPCAIVLEDDVTIDPAFPQVALNATNVAPKNWDYIHLSSVVKKSVLAIEDLGHTRKLIRYSRLPVNTAAYILSNRGARKWLNPTQRKRPNDVDVRYALHCDLDVLGVYPAIAHQANNFPSDIWGEHRTSSANDTRSWSPGPLSRLRVQIWTMRRFGPLTFAQARGWNILNAAVRRIQRAKQRRVTILHKT